MVLRTTKTTCSITGFQSLDVVSGTSAYSQIQLITGGTTGNRICISEDGNYLLISDPQYNSARGRISIYVKSGSTYTLSSTITGTTAGNQWGYASSGSGMAINSNGTYLAFATRLNSPTNNYNSVRIYTRSGSTWTLQQTIQPSILSLTYFGSSMFFSTTADQLVIGNSQESSFTGAVYMFSRSGSTWTQNAAFSGTTNSNFGITVAVNSDASSAFIGYGNLTGPKWYTRSGSTWTDNGSVGTGIYTIPYSTSVSNDSNYLAINNNVYYPSNTWSTYSSAGSYGGNNWLSKDGNYIFFQNQFVYQRNVNDWDYFASINLIPSPRGGIDQVMSDGTGSIIVYRGGYSGETSKIYIVQKN
jgi:hypothetical protein